MARRGFNPEGMIGKPLGYVGEVVTLSLLWGLCSIPLVTIGPATAALYDCTVHCLRRKEDDLPGRFWRTFKAEFKIGLLSTLLWALVLGLLFFLRARFLTGSAFVGMLSLFLLLIPTGVACWVFPLLSRFEFGFSALNRCAVQLALGNILQSLAMAVLTLLGAELCLRFASPLIFVPGLVALLWSLLIEPVFRRYGEQTETEPEIEKE